METYNRYNSSLESLGFDELPQEIKDQYLEFVSTVPLIKRHLSPSLKRACDLPRDNKGRIIVDVTQPHILEDMDYFMQTVLHFKKYGCYTKLRPNMNPTSEFGKWFKEEVRRCLCGMVRESDGEWITGDYYFFLNYCPMQVTKKSNSGRINRVMDFPSVWETHYYKTHYLEQARNRGEHAAELASRGKGKSFLAAALLAKRFILGESPEVTHKVISYIMAFDKAKLTGGDQTLNKFLYDIDHCAKFTQFPFKRLINTLNNMEWKMGYKDLDTGAEMGTLNAVVGKSLEDESKLRGSRGVLYLFEEAGSFPNLLASYNNLRDSVEEGNESFGQLFLYGTTGDDTSDFASMQEIMYNPDGYKVYKTENVYDKEGLGRRWFSFFSPAYLNLAGCYDENGNSDVSKALIQILNDRRIVKYNSTDVNTITKRIAERPITPQEAILRVHHNIFPVTEINQRIAEIDADPSFYDGVYVGTLVQQGNGEVVFNPTDDEPIRDFPTKTNRVRGAMEIYELPIYVRGKVPFGRYIVSLDNYENDVADSMSLGSMFVLDTVTDQIVAEYTGRPDFADDLNEIVRKTCLFYNARCLYEAHPYDQIVRTPDGVRQWGDVKVGDRLFAPDGELTKVIDIPVDGEDDIYRITLADGRVVESSGNHIWHVSRLGMKDKQYDMTVNEMLKYDIVNKHGQKRFFIREAGAVEYEHKDVPIDPYTLGLLIAEGTMSYFRKANKRRSTQKTIPFASCEEDFEFYKTVVPYEMRHGSGAANMMYIPHIAEILDELGLSHHKSNDKFIPELYLYNDYNTRLELLKGLMDGDGCAVRNGASVFITISERLKDDIMLLCRSLGMKAFENHGTEPHSYINKDGYEFNCQKSYRVAIATDKCIFKLPRKISKQHIYRPDAKGSKAKGLLFKTAIKSIDYVGKKKCRCVTVDRSDGLYLIGDYVVTHNCNKKNTFAYFKKMNCLHLLADTPEWLRQKEMVRTLNYGNSAKGVSATVIIKKTGLDLMRDWLLKPVVTIQKGENGEEVEVTVPNLHFIKSRALLREMSLYNPDINVDRIMSMVQLMLYREEVMITAQSVAGMKDNRSDIEKDPFFARYDSLAQRRGMNI